MDWSGIAGIGLCCTQNTPIYWQRGVLVMSSGVLTAHQMPDCHLIAAVKVCNRYKTMSAKLLKLMENAKLQVKGS